MKLFIPKCVFSLVAIATVSACGDKNQVDNSSIKGNVSSPRWVTKVALSNNVRYRHENGNSANFEPGDSCYLKSNHSVVSAGQGKYTVIDYYDGSGTCRGIRPFCASPSNPTGSECAVGIIVK